MKLSLRGSRTVVERAPENPFLLPEPEKEEQEALGNDQILGGKTSFTNVFAADPARAQLLGIGGGVGVTTLVEASKGVLAEADPGDSAPVLLVTTTAADRLERAQQALASRQDLNGRAVSMTSDGRQIVGLVMVHDRPKLSKDSVRQAKRVVRMADRAWVVPWLGYLREPGEHPPKPPLRFRRVITELTKAVAS